MQLNQRVAIVALSTKAVMPVPMPTTTPHSRISCQTWFMPSDSTSAVTTVNSAVSVTLRRPYLFISAAAKGAISPNRMKRMESAEEISAVLQPNSFCRGTMNTPGAPTAPAETIAVRKVTPTITQP